MEFVGFILIVAAVFGVCFLIDRGFTRLFRSQAQHQSGLAVRLNKKYGAFGIVLAVLGIASFLSGLKGDKLMLYGGILVFVLGVGLTVYYMTSAIFYDEDAFIYNSFARKSRRYAYRDIEAQQLFNASGNIVVELHMKGGDTVTVQSTMNGAYDFLDYAFAAWCRQKQIDRDSCTFHDPANSCWFPAAEEL